MTEKGHEFLFVVRERDSTMELIRSTGFNYANSDPTPIDYVIPANDDATKSVDMILTACCDAIAEGLAERKAEKGDEAASDDEEKAEKPRKERIRKISRKGEAAEEAPAAVEEAPAAEAPAEEAPAKPKRTRKAAAPKDDKKEEA